MISEGNGEYLYLLQKFNYKSYQIIELIHTKHHITLKFHDMNYGYIEKLLICRTQELVDLYKMYCYRALFLLFNAFVHRTARLNQQKSYHEILVIPYWSMLML